MIFLAMCGNERHMAHVRSADWANGLSLFLEKVNFELHIVSVFLLALWPSILTQSRLPESLYPST